MDARSVLELGVDAERGEATRYVDDDDGFSAITTELDTASSLNINMYEETQEQNNPEQAQLSGSVGIGTALTYNGSTTNYTLAVVYESSDGPVEEDLRTVYEELISQNFPAENEPTIGTSGRVGTIEFSFPTEEF
jgi:hypothetical protein